MNVWILKDGEPVPGFDKGARMMRAFCMGEYLSKQGHNVTWWTSNWSHYKKKKYTESDHDQQVNDNYTIKMLDACGYNKNVSFQRMRHYSTLAKKFMRLAKEMPQPDLIISSLPTVEFSHAAVNYAEQVKCPVIVDLRDMWPDIMVEIFPKILRPFARVAAHHQFAMMKSLCKRASGFIGISPPYLEWAANYAGRKVSERDKVVSLVSPNFQNKEPVDDVASKAHFKNLGVSFDGKFNIVYAGNYSKNTADLAPVIQAFKYLPDDYQLLIAGSAAGDEAVENDYRQLAKDLPQVHFLGWLNSGQLDYMYRHAHVAVAPYVTKEYFKMNLTNKPIEYIHYGLPILTSVDGYLSELLKKESIGYHYPQQPRTIAQMIESFKSDEEAYLQQRQRCQKLYQEQFEYEKVMHDFMQYLKNQFNFGAQ